MNIYERVYLPDNVINTEDIIAEQNEVPTPMTFLF